MVISPAKTLDFETPPVTRQHTQPALLKRAAELVDVLRFKSPADLSELMAISAKLGELNSRRFLEWQPPFALDNAKQAVLAFRGDVYTGLDADDFSAEDFKFAQRHLRILSGLYGVLRPLDLTQPYRLEMGTRLENPGGRNLYEFWGDAITANLKRQLERLDEPVLLNLASDEYFKAVRPRGLCAEVIQPVFQDLKGGKYKVVSFYAKKARGMMAAWVIRNRVTRAQTLKRFDGGGYRYDADSSEPHRWVFRRDTD